MICNNCNSNESAVDTAQGAVYCTTCGMVQEENSIVNTVSFTENNTLSGRIVDMDSKQVGTVYVDSSFYIKNTIRSICIGVGLGSDFVDCSFRWYKLLLPYNLSKGKSILYTLSACVYITCRQERTPHMLIDFSSTLNIDVFKIGKSYLKITKLLGVDTPVVDPSLYMPRYISKLKFKSSQVLNFSLRMVSRMKRDWIVVGRRPNNLCGAALVIASRVFKEERSIEEVARVVNVSVTTINKRMKEIGETESANLSVEEFNSVWLEKEEDPPIMRIQGGPSTNESVSCTNESVGYTSRDFLYPTPEEEKEEVTPSSEDEILSPEETEERKKIWDEMYGEYMREKESKPKKVVKKRRRRKEVGISEVLKNLDKKISSKLNYQAIENLFDSF